jgi:hypothetical protein
LRRFEFRRLLLLPALLVAGFAAGCSDDNSSTPQAPPPVELTDTFAGTVTVNGAFSHNFEVTRAGAVTAKITALAPDSAVTVGFALGIWNGTACQLIITNDMATASTTINGTATAPGTLCVRVSDVGQLSAPSDYEVQVAHF